MAFTPTKVGHCDCCYHPNGDASDKPLEVTTFDAGGGDIHEQQLCEACSMPRPLPKHACPKCGYTEGDELPSDVEKRLLKESIERVTGKR